MCPMVTINYPKAKKTSIYQGIANLNQDTKLFQINDNLDIRDCLINSVGLRAQAGSCAIVRAANAHDTSAAY